MVCNSDQIKATHVYTVVLIVQIILGAHAFVLIVSFNNAPTLKLITWIEIWYFVTSCVAIVESIIIAGIMTRTTKGNTFIPRYRIIIGILLLACAIPFVVRTVSLQMDGIPECLTKEPPSRKKANESIVLDQPPCQQFLFKISMGVCAIINAILYFITAFVNPIKTEHEKQEAERGVYSNVSPNDTTTNV